MIDGVHHPEDEENGDQSALGQCDAARFVGLDLLKREQFVSWRGSAGGLPRLPEFGTQEPLACQRDEAVEQEPEVFAESSGEIESVEHFIGEAPPNDYLLGFSMLTERSIREAVRRLAAD